jgi:hypothetical protein
MRPFMTNSLFWFGLFGLHILSIVCRLLVVCIFFCWTTESGSVGVLIGCWNLRGLWGARNALVFFCFLGRLLLDSDLRKTALARASRMYNRQTRPLVREGAPHLQDRNCETVINIWSWSSDSARHQDLLTDWLIVCRNVILTSTWHRDSVVSWMSELKPGVQESTGDWHAKTLHMN